MPILTRGRWLAALGAVVLFALGWGARGWLDGGGRPSRRVRLGGYRLVSPLLDVELPEGYSIEREPIPFRAKVAAFVAERVRSGQVGEMSVYYRDLLDGPWFSVNERRRYDPASMMKVPVMIAWLKRAERDPRVLEERIPFDARVYPGSAQQLPPERSLVDGRAYTVEELLRFMLAYSDNRAMWLLFGGLKPAEVDDVIDSMDVSNEPGEAGNSMSVVDYSGFFRVLFNASYLNREMSERALELLALQEFPEGFVAGVPKGTVVASKFGETTPSRTGELQLHEFGIVYAPSGPYILGAMTTGHDRAAQAAALRDLSALVYAEVEAHPSRRTDAKVHQAAR